MADPAPLIDTDPTEVGEYTLVGRLGQGGQGVVYLGRHADGSQAAVKMLHGDALDVAGLRVQLAEEVEMARRVARFCTAQVLSADIEANPPYVVSEYVEGPSLHGVIRENGPLGGAALERLAVGTITALAAIHQAGIVHRDFKPANVLVAPGGPRVIDFGIARVLEGTAILTSRIAGTPAYMAPEQITGGPLGPAVDLFAWGATLAYAANGAGPFGHDSLRAVVHRVINEEPELGDLSGPLRGIAERCLDKDPARRPTAAEALLWVLGVEAEAAPEPEEPEAETAVPVAQQTLVAGAIAAADTGAQESAAAEIYRSYPPATRQGQATFPPSVPARPVPQPPQPPRPPQPPPYPSGPQARGYQGGPPPIGPATPPPIGPATPPPIGPATPPPVSARPGYPVPQPQPQWPRPPAPAPVQPVRQAPRQPSYPVQPPPQHGFTPPPSRPRSSNVNMGVLLGVVTALTILGLILIGVVAAYYGA
ncbi:serine/threonine-protein kinase [Actinorugispora endophytica]|uniref:Serine/threonine protein kinase n=1 Tax=Actinorugispora endophytica TaxID=1605990 RepID=A0A4R6V3K6_9ACTN|nr:serine/threonine-protein kinase [Actinorugispora endophytica]TDQ54753.1 serine/threonine protein kinase [Actinorugispora endophytica]